VCVSVVDLEMADLQAKIGQIAKNKGNPVILVCQTGQQSQKASRAVSDAGYTEVHVLQGGLDANDPAIEKLVREVVSAREVPVVVDAGALWFFNQPNGLLQRPNREGGLNQDVVSYALTYVRASAAEPPLIFTPHEGEFLRLLGTEDKDAIKDRVAAVREFSQRNNVFLILKGERVLIGEPGGKVVVNPTGNSGLGKAGNGDTLTGILVGFLAQGAKMNIDVFETVVASVYVAGMAGDIAEKKYGKRVMTASDVRECLVEAFSELSASS